MSLPEYSRQPPILAPHQYVLGPRQQRPQQQRPQQQRPQQQRPRQQQRPQQQRQRPPRSQANRYNTPVAVEVYEDTILRRVKWFSDLQLAYIWSMNEALQHRDERWSRLHTAFERFANSMDRRWRFNQTGKAVARSKRYEWYLSYEPDVIPPLSSE